jgi:electron transport complex protein RnfG
VEDRFKITDGDQERNVFVGVFGGTADTVVVEASANGYGDKVGLVVAINMAEETLARHRRVTTHKETPGLGAEAKADPAFAAQFAGKASLQPHRRHHRRRPDQCPERRHDYLAGCMQRGQHGR